MSRALRPLAWVMAIAALGCGGGARRRGQRRRTGSRPAGVAHPADGGPVPPRRRRAGGVGLFVALRRPGNVVAWILLARRAVGRDRDGRRRASRGSRSTTTRLHARRLGGARPAAWPVIFLWPLALAFVYPGRAAAVAALAARRAASRSLHSALILLLLIGEPLDEGPTGDVPSPLRARDAPESSDRVLGLLVRAARLAVRRRGCAAGALPRGRPGAAPPGAVAGLRRAAAAALAGRRLAADARSSSDRATRRRPRC